MIHSEKIIFLHNITLQFLNSGRHLRKLKINKKWGEKK